MEASGDFSKNDTEQQQQQQQTTAASIVSSMTTATPITSEIISDFEPDPKFDITPLERASYDCQEIYSIESSLDQHEQEEQQQSLSENNDDTSQASSSDQQNMQSEQNREKDQSIHEITTLKQPNEPQAKEDETKFDDKSLVENINSLEQANKLNEGPSLSEITPSLTASENNDCNSEKTHPNGAEISLTSASEHPIQLETSNMDLFERIEDHCAGVQEAVKVSVPVQEQQQSSNVNHMQTQPQSSTENDLSNLLSLSRQVIDNVVELGDVHQFSQSLGHSETEEKLLDIQSIHRDLISERSSIDLIADVASRQQSIEITPVNVPMPQEKPEPCVTPAQGHQEPDLMKSYSITNVLKPGLVSDQAIEIQSADVNKQTPESHSTAEDKLETAETKQDSSQPKLVNDEEIKQPPMEIPQESIIEESIIEEHVTEEPVTEEPIIEEPIIEEPIIEEPVIEETVTDVPLIEEPVESLEIQPVSGRPEQVPEESKAAHVVDLEPMTVKPLITTDHDAEESHLEPVTEEAVLKEDGNPAVEETKMETGDLDVPSEVVKPSKNDILLEDKMDVDEQKSPEAGRRRSGRKIKVSEKVVDLEKSITKRSRRASKIEEKSVTEPEVPEIVPSVEKTAETHAPEVEPAKDLESSEETNEVATEAAEPPVVSETLPSKEVQEDPVEEPAVESAPAVEPSPVTEEASAEESQDEPEVKANTRTTRAVRERLVKALRPRESAKRAREDELSKPEPPKIEPPKKQVKKMRGATGETATATTTSYEAPKNKTSIKLPNYRSRQTISSSDPVTRLDKRYESDTAPANSQPDSDKGFRCHQCGFSTGRLNNLMYHALRGYCPGKCVQGEVMKADITRQQQTPKSKRKSIR